MFDAHNDILQKVALNTGTINSDTTTAGNILDILGYEALEFIIQSGNLTAGTFTPLIEHGDEPAMGDAEAVPDSQLLGTEAAAAFASGDDNEAKRIGYRGSKRYVRLSLVSAGSADGVIGATAILSRGQVNPTPAQ